MMSVSGGVGQEGRFGVCILSKNPQLDLNEFTVPQAEECREFMDQVVLPHIKLSVNVDNLPHGLDQVELLLQ